MFLNSFIQQVNILRSTNYFLLPTNYNLQPRDNLNMYDKWFQYIVLH